MKLRSAGHSGLNRDLPGSILDFAFAYICKESRLIRYRNNPTCFLIAVIITVLDAARAGPAEFQTFGLLNQMERPHFVKCQKKLPGKWGQGEKLPRAT